MKQQFAKHLLELPEVLIIRSLSLLNPSDLARFSQVSKKCHELANKDELWKNLVLRRFSITEKGQDSWKEIFKNAFFSVYEIKKILMSLEKDKGNDRIDWVNEIQELKRNLVSEVRKNYVLNRELQKLDKRIALLIKNQNGLKEILQQTNANKSTKSSGEKSELSPRKIELYENLFYLLQTEPKYLANLVYLMKPEQMESFLDTVILTLYGDAFSPREEFLILRLFQLSIEKEMSALKTLGDFLKADSVVPKMVITYNRRKQGSEYLQSLLGPLLKDIVQKDVNLELKPVMIYQNMINEQEIASGEKSSLDRNLPEEKIIEMKEVEDIVKQRILQLESNCQQFFDQIIQNLEKIPYGIRWICKQIRSLAESHFSNLDEDDILLVISYFVYYRFINVVIVTPYLFDIGNITPLAQKNLVSISKVLQNLFNFRTFTKNDRWMMSMNPWIKRNLDTARDFFNQLIDVPDPEEYLQVDKYMELTQTTKPVIMISLDEIVETHKILREHENKLLKDKDDPFRLILSELGEPPNVSKEDDREIQLTLSSRFQKNVDEEKLLAPYAETKELILSTLIEIPVDKNDETLFDVLKAGRKYARDKNDPNLVHKIDKIVSYIQFLENEGLVTSKDKYIGFMKDIALEVTHRAEKNEERKKEIARLNKTLKKLRAHQKYLQDQIQQYHDYLLDCRSKKHPKRKVSKSVSNPDRVGPFKFTYHQLNKKGVIIESEVPEISRKRTEFFISSESAGVFDIVAKIAGVSVEKMTIELDDLLERNYNNIARLELEQVTLDVNLTLHLLNKCFYS